MAEASPSSPSSATVRSDTELEEMLNRMLTRLALCDDCNLQALLSKLLPLAISSLSCPSSTVRNKVLEILSHVNKRVKHQPEIGLPLSDLWRIYTEANVVSIVKNFCILYIEMAFERNNVKEIEMMAPILAANASKLPHQHQEIVLRLAVKVIGECHSTRVNAELAAMYKALNNPQDKEGFIEFCLHNILYQPSSQGGGSSPGLSIAQANRITGKQQLTNDILLKRKLGILNVVEAMELTPEVVYPLYLAASADSQEAVAVRGHDLSKKASDANFDDPSLIKRLFLLFNGSSGADSVAPDSKIAPANSALKAKLMSVFFRSTTAANSFPSTLQCIFECIYGQGTTRSLKKLGMQFVFWVFKHAEFDQLNLMSPVILNIIKEALDRYSSSESDTNANDTETLAFQAIGSLAERMPQLFRDKVDMAARLFDALKLEAPSLRVMIQEATVSLAAAYKDASITVLKDLETLLLENLKQEQSEVRYCAVSWATTLFDLQHCPSRYLCMLGAADDKLDIREMSLEGLFPGKDNGQPTHHDISLKYPKLGDMLAYILKQRPEVLESIETREQQLLFPSETYTAMIKFLLKCFESEKLLSKTDGGPSEFSSSVKNICLLLDHAMVLEGSVELHACAARALVAIGSHAPQVIVPHYATKVPWLKQLLSHWDIDTRETAARLLGMASSGLLTTAASALISELVFSISNSRKIRFDYHYGAVCAIGYITADCICRTPPIQEVLLQSVLKCLVDVVNSENATLASIAMQALGHIGLRVPLPSIADESTSADIFMILQEKLRKLLSGDDTKAIQKIAISLGQVCMKETSSSHLNIAIDLVFSLCRSKVEDVLFAAGEALSLLWGTVPGTADTILNTNYTSLSMSSNYPMENMSTSLTGYNSDGMIEDTEGSRASVRNAITRKLIDDLPYSHRKEERCAGTVWLLSLTMYCGHDANIQRKLPKIQEAFLHLLCERNELTQELASQGMSIVYELGDAPMKENLEDALVNTLTGSRKRERIKPVEVSEVHQEAAIGGSLSRGKLSAYKELCNMANDMGQPGLIYKFMDLANHHASLNSKRDAAFSLTNMAKQAADALQPHLRGLIPRLVRYKYDPDKNVQDTMTHIWQALVKDTKRTIDEHFDLIMDELVTQCGSTLMPTREASCRALANIVQGRKLNQVGKHLEKVWIAAFQAMNDINGTIRISGHELCGAVSSLTIGLCDVNRTEVSDSHQVMDIVLPYLLKEGIRSMIDTTRIASINVVMKLAKGAGVTLRPYLADLVPCMLESLSSLEHQGLNYVELHATNIGLNTEKLENLRILNAKSSSMWETLGQCIKVVDAESLKSLVPQLAQMVPASVGLNTRVGVASFIGLLVEKVGIDIKPFANTLLKLLFGAVKKEKAPTVKRAFSGACALVLKHASTSEAQNLIEDLKALHAGDSAILLKSILSIAPDVASGYYAEILPVIFISRFEDDKKLSGTFEELWEENISGEKITLQLYMREIVSLIRNNISSSSWGSKKKAAQAICKLGEVLGESLSPCHQDLLVSLMKELPGLQPHFKKDLSHAPAGYIMNKGSLLSDLTEGENVTVSNEAKKLEAMQKQRAESDFVPKQNAQDTEVEPLSGVEKKDANPHAALGKVNSSTSHSELEVGSHCSDFESKDTDKKMKIKASPEYHEGEASGSAVSQRPSEVEHFILEENKDTAYNEVHSYPSEQESEVDSYCSGLEYEVEDKKTRTEASSEYEIMHLPKMQKESSPHATLDDNDASIDMLSHGGKQERRSSKGCGAINYDSILDHLIKSIAKSDIEKIGIYGKNEVGKAIVIEALEESAILRNLFDRVICVTVPPNGDMEKVRMEIAGQISSDLTEANAVDVPHSVVNALEGLKFLLILVGINQHTKLETLRIPVLTPRVGSKIVFVTGAGQLYDEIEVDKKICLDDLLFLELFCQNVGAVVHSNDVQFLAGEIVRMCKNYSHAVILVARALRNVDDILIWKRVLERLTSQPASHEAGIEALMLNVLRFSIDQLEDDKTRRCLKNLALCNNYHEIASESAICLWVREGIVGTHDEGQKVLKNLVNANLLEIDENGQFVKFQDQDKDILVNLIFQPEENRVFLMRGGLDLTEPPEVEEWESAKEICLMHTGISKLPKEPRCPSLSSLYLQRNYKLRKLSSSFFNQMPSLEVLNLSRTRIRCLPESISQLISLKRLFLNDCVLLRSISPAIGRLKQLEVFDLEGTKIKNIPKEIECLINLTCLGISISGTEPSDDSKTVIPCGVISSLLHLEELNLDVDADAKWWDTCAEGVVSEVCNLKRLSTFKFSFPTLELWRQFNQLWKSMEHPSLAQFRLCVGNHANSIMSRLPLDIKFELERCNRFLRYKNGDGVFTDIKDILQQSDAFFLERHANLRKLSELGIDSMHQLKWCVLGECNELEVLVDASETLHQEALTESHYKSICLQSLEFLYVYYMRNLRNIWRGSVQKGCLSSLKLLTLCKCPELTVIFSHEMLGNLNNLEEVKIEDCPTIKSLITCQTSTGKVLETPCFLPNLKKLSLHYVPKLSSISCGLQIASSLERLSFYNCLSLKSLSTNEVSSGHLKKIRGERSWWTDLEWHGHKPDYLDGIFVHIDTYDIP